VDRLKKILQAETVEIRQAMADLAAEYEVRVGGFYLDEVAGGFQIRTRPQYTDWIKKLIRPKPLRLSKPALETLVIIAYKQPIIRSDIEHLRGVDCGGVIRVLLERKLIRVLGRKEIAGRPLIYATTKRFLEIFDLKNLRDLPTPKEIEELAKTTNEGNQAVIVDSTDEMEEKRERSEDLEPGGDEERQVQTEPIQSSETIIPRDTLRDMKTHSTEELPENPDETT
jgi:segregation and condensation protein B